MDDQGGLYVGGQTTGTLGNQILGTSAASNAVTEAYLAKIDASSGALDWAAQFGGISSISLFLTYSGFPVVSLASPVTLGTPWGTVGSGTTNAVVTRMDPTLGLGGSSWIRYLSGGAGTSASAYGVVATAEDAHQSLFINGSVSANLPGSTELGTAGTNEALLIKISTSGDLE